jgi:hypothetical protein
MLGSHRRCGFSRELIQFSSRHARVNTLAHLLGYENAVYLKVKERRIWSVTTLFSHFFKRFETRDASSKSELFAR